MQVMVNAEPLEIADGATVATLVTLRRPKPPFAVEVNAQLVRRTTYEQTRLRPGDRIEIVTLVGGG